MVNPLGSLLGGALANLIGATDTLIISGIFCILGSLFFSRQLPALKKNFHAIYLKKGILIELPDPTSIEK